VSDTIGDAAVAKEGKLHPAPDVGDILFVFIILIPLMVLPNLLFGDGSTGWHLVTGDYVLNNHAVPRQDLFSYAFPDKPWVAYEWLSDAVMAGLVRVGGLNLLAVAVSSAIGLLFMILYDRCRKEGCHFFIVLIICMIGILVSAMHWLARPHIFTFFGVLIFYSALEDYYRRTISSTRMIITLALYMVLWVNCHPAFVLGFALILIYLCSSVATALYYAHGKLRTERWQSVRTYAIALAATFVATLCNPYGYSLYTYIAQYLKGSAVLAATDEFLSPVFHYGLHATCLELLFATFVIGLAISVKRLSLPQLLCCIAFSHLALNAVRNMPLAVIILLPAIALLLSKTRLSQPALPESSAPSESTASQSAPSDSSPSTSTPSDSSPSESAAPQSTPSTSTPADSSPSTSTPTASTLPAVWWTIFVRKWNRFGDMIHDMEWQCKMHLLPIATVILLSITAMMHGNILGTQWLDSGFDPKTKPTTTLDYLKKQELAGTLKANKGFNFDNWGGYITYKIGTRVFIDDRADFYGERYYLQYSVLSQVLPGWKDALKKEDIQWLLFPKDSRLAQALMAEAGWKIAAQDAASYLLVRPVTATAQ
jgi:hypothetical protein